MNAIHIHDDERVMVAGATSIHGWSLVQARGDRRVIPVCNTHIKGSFCRDWNRVDTENTEGWVHLLDEVKPATLIYCAGVCNVEQCRKHPEWARELNVNALKRLLTIVPDDVSLVYLSTDHVFSDHDSPRVETDEPEPLSKYGEIRAEAEQVLLNNRPDALLIRPGLCLGPSADGRRGHWCSAQRRLKAGQTVTVIDGECRSAMWAPDAAQRIWEWIDQGLQGIHHLAAERVSSRIEIIEAICEVNQLPTDFRIVDRKDLESPHLGRVPLATEKGHAPLTAFPDRVRELFGVQEAGCV